MNTATIYPKHDIDPARKKADWILQYIKAAWRDFEGGTNRMFARSKTEYDEIHDYVMGKQSIEKYKQLLLRKDKDAERSHLAIDWAVRPIAAKIRDIMVAKVLERGQNIGAYPMDSTAKDEADKYFQEAAVKIAMRESAMQVDPSLAQNPVIMRAPGEVEDLEELEISKEFGFKLKMAMEAEMGVELVFYNSDWNEIRKINAENLVDLGVACTKEYIDENGMPAVREVQPERVMISNCERADFSDKTHVGELILVPVSKLASKFSRDQIREITDNATRTIGDRNAEITEYNDEYDAFKVQVLDFEFMSYDTVTYRTRVNKNGNEVVRPAKTWRRTVPTDMMVDVDGALVPQYTNRTKEVIYKGKWIVGTNYIYDEGVLGNQKRGLFDKGTKTDFSYHLHATHFKNMQWSSMMKRIIPIIDEMQMTVYKIQNFKNRWIPYIMNIDFDAMEEVSLIKGGDAMQPHELMDMVLQTYILPTRRSNLAGDKNINYKSVEIQPTQMEKEFLTLVGDLSRLMNEIRDVTGLNEVTDGSSPNPNMLNYVASLGATATNNALRPVMNSDRKLGENTAKGVIGKLISVIKSGKEIQGLVSAMGPESVKFVKVSPDLGLHDWGIKVEDRPTTDERQMLMQQVAMKDANGQIEPDDYFLIMHTENLKQAGALLAHRVKKRNKARQQEAMMMQQQNGQIQQQSSMVAEQGKQQTMQMQSQLNMTEAQQKFGFDQELLRQKLVAAQMNAETQVAGKVTTQDLANDGKMAVAEHTQENKTETAK